MFHSSCSCNVVFQSCIFVDLESQGWEKFEVHILSSKKLLGSGVQEKKTFFPPDDESFGIK